MAEVINMPRLSDTMEEGTVATWLKKVGDKVVEGDILAEIETDKATMEFESFYEGTLLHIGVAEGETASVDKLLAIIGEKDEDISGLIDGKGSDDGDSNKSKDSKDKKVSSKEKSEDEGNEGEDKKESSEKSSADDDKKVEKKPTEKDKSEDAENKKKDVDSTDDDDENDQKNASSEIPEGVEIINMPRLSDTMEEGTVATWLKKEGDKVEEGDILAEIETDKATMEFESFYSGTLLKIGVQEGETAKVDELLAIIGPKGTDVSGISGGKSEPKPKKKEKDSVDKVNVKNDEDSDSKKESKSEETEKEKKATSGDKDNIKSSSEISNTDKKESSGSNKTYAKSDARIFASPLAKKLAEDKGISLKLVNGSGENGRIVKDDIENYQASAGSYKPVGTESFEEIKNSTIRKTIAKRLAESKFSAPHYYLTVEFDMENAIAARNAINDDPSIKISFNDMVVKACAMALRKHPQVNSQWTPEATKIAKHIHIGVAVAVEEGLLVPVLKFADQMSFIQIGTAVKDLAVKARTKKITPQEMEGSTFTVSNLGMFGIREFTSIINAPNSAILSVGTIVEKPVVKNGQIVVGNTMTVTLACDHRTVDGATGAKFLETVRKYVESPITMFV